MDEPLTNLRRRRRARGLGGRGGAALTISFVAHSVFALAVGVVVRGSHLSGDAQQESVEVDIAPAVVAEVPPTMPTPTPSALDHDTPRATAAGRRTPKALRVAAAPRTEALAPIDAAEAPAPRFVMSAGTVATRKTFFSPGTFREPATNTAGTAAAENDVDAPARLLTASPLVYPPAARQALVETDFPVEIVVGVDGRVISARPLRRAGYGLDEAAVRAVLAYLFSPAVRGGRAVSVRMHWTVQFRLQ